MSAIKNYMYDKCIELAEEYGVPSGGDVIHSVVMVLMDHGWSFDNAITCIRNAFDRHGLKRR